MSSETLQTLPRLTEPGDRAVLPVASVVLQETAKGQGVVFTFTGYADSLMLPRLGVDGALIRLGYYDPPTRGGSEPDGVVLYDQVAGDFLEFARTEVGRNGKPGWRIDAAPKAEQAGVAEPPKASAERTPEVRQPDLAEQKRQVVRDRYLAEVEHNMNVVVPAMLAIAKKHKIKVSINFDVNAAVANQVISMEKRGG